MRRVLYTATFLVLLLTLGVGAGAQVTTIDFWFGETTESYIRTMQAIVDRFEAENPTIKVNFEQHGTIQGAKLEQLKVAIAGGVPPDIAYLDDTAIFELGYGAGMFIPLNDLLSPEDIATFDYLPVPTQSLYYNDVWYGLPFRTDSRGIYINEDLFGEAGLDPRVGFATLNDLDDAAAKLTLRDASGNISRLGFAPYGNNFGGEIAWLWLFGGTMYDWEKHRPTLVEHPENLAAMEWIQGYADRYGPTASTNVTNWYGGTVSMRIDSTTRLRHYAEEAPHLNWWVSQIPAPPGGRKTTLSTVLALGIPRGAAYPEAAAQFVKFLSDPEIQIFWYQNTQSLPARRDALMDVLRDISDPRERLMVEMLPEAEGYPPLFAYGLRPEFQLQANRMRQRQITPLQALENTQRIMWPLFQEVFGGDW